MTRTPHHAALSRRHHARLRALRAESDLTSSACKNIWFCSAQCQTMLWPVHKFLCKADPTIFRQAPLTKEELAHIERLSSEKCNVGRRGPSWCDDLTVRQTLLGMTFQKNWSDVLDLLVSPTTDPTPAREVDDVREDAISNARSHIADLCNVRDDAPFAYNPLNSPWFYMADCMATFGAAYGFFVVQDNLNVHWTPRLIKELNEVLRQTLIQCTVEHCLTVHATSRSALIQWLPLLYLAQDRAILALDQSNIDPRIVARLRPQLISQYEVFKDRIRREDGTMPPAVHP